MDCNNSYFFRKKRKLYAIDNKVAAGYNNEKLRNRREPIDSATYIAALFLLVFVFIAMVALMCVPSHILNREKHLIYSMLVLSLIYMCAEMLERFFITEKYFYYGREIFCVISYGTVPFILLIFYDIVVGLNRKNRWMWLLPCSQAAVFAYSLFSQASTFLPNLGIEFTYDNKAKFGYLYQISVVVPALIIGITVFSVAAKRKRKEISSSEANMIYFLLAVNAIAWMMEMYWDDVYLVGTVIFISIVIYYAFLYIYHFKQYEEDVLKKHEIEIVISQIHPHFIYNTLNSIYGEFMSQYSWGEDMEATLCGQMP